MEDGSIKRLLKLETYHIRLVEYLRETGFNTAFLENFKFYKKIILNPLSHDNLHSPVYKRELEQVFNLYESYGRIKNELIISCNQKEVKTLNLSIHGKDKIYYEYQVQLLENLRKITFFDQSKCSPCRGRVIKLKVHSGNKSWQEIDNGLEGSLENLYKNLCSKHGVNAGDFTKKYRNKKNVTLSKLLNS